MSEHEQDIALHGDDRDDERDQAAELFALLRDAPPDRRAERRAVPVLQD